MGLELDGVNGIIKNTTSDGDVTIKGNDGGSEISLLAFDVSAEGVATFNSKVGIKDSAPDVLLHVNQGAEPPAEGMFILEANSASRQLRIQPPTNSDNGFIDYRGGNLTFLDDGTEVARFQGTTGFGIGTSTVNSKLEVAGNATITTADNTDTLSLISTDGDALVGPVLRLFRNSSSPADDDVIGNIVFSGQDGAGNETDFLTFQVNAGDVANGAEDGFMRIMMPVASTSTEFFRMNPAGFVFNEGSADLDFRVESNDGTHALFVDAGNNVVIVGGIDGSGTTPVPTNTNGGTDPVFQLQGANNANQHTFHISAAINAQNNPGSIVFSKSRDNTLNGNTILQNGDRIGEIIFCGADGTDRNSEAAKICADVGGAPGSNDMPGRLEFYTTADGAHVASERMRIASTGNIHVGSTDTSPAFGITIADTRVTSGVCLDVHHSKSDTTFSGMVARLQSARNTTNETYEFIRAGISGIANKFVVHDSGDVDNTNNSYGGISDERVKQDITDANSQWNDIKALKIKNFKKKANVRDFGDDALKELGVIAQDLEAAGMNGLVKESKPDPSHIYSDSSFGTLWTADDSETQDFVLFTADDEEVKEGNAQIGDIKKHSSEVIGEVKEVKEKVKTVKYSVLYMKAIKALQEAQTRIETLETKVAALEG